MSQIAVHFRIKAKDGRGADLLATLAPIIEQVENEPGTLIYAVNRSAQDPDLFFVFELHADREASRVHVKSPVATAAMPAMAELIEESELIVATPVSVKGLPR